MRNIHFYVNRGRMIFTLVCCLIVLVASIVVLAAAGPSAERVITPIVMLALTAYAVYKLMDRSPQVRLTAQGVWTKRRAIPWDSISNVEATVIGRWQRVVRITSAAGPLHINTNHLNVGNGELRNLIVRIASCNESERQLLIDYLTGKPMLNEERAALESRFMQ